LSVPFTSPSADFFVAMFGTYGFILDFGAAVTR
jgi:hypothetical protein